MSVTQEPWGKAEGGEEVSLFTLRSGKIEARITNYGGRIVSLLVPDKQGSLDNIVLGFDTLDGYLGENPYFGALIGRYANRIAGGRFTLDGKQYQLPTNHGPNTLHGGTIGFDRRIWSAQPGESGGTDATLELRYVSPNGEENFPGTVDVTVIYTLTESGELRIDYRATAEGQATIINLTNHSYFNLRGAGNGDVLGHELMIAADQFTPTDSTAIPYGDLRDVAGTPFDFRTPKPVGRDIDDTADEQIRFGHGYDHNLVLNHAPGELALIARVAEPTTGRVMEVYTTQPGVQLYTGNYLDGTIKGHGGKTYNRRGAICLETQHFPDSPNHPNFPSTVLRPGEEMRETTVYKFV